MSFTINDLPSINTTFNALALCCLVLGVFAIKKGKRQVHQRFMLAAVAFSGLFLSCYLIYHFAGESKKYTGEWGFIYFPMLVSHILLAISIPFFVVRLLWLAHKKYFDRHKKLARVAFPIWAYVSLTGILVYLFVHR